LCGSRLVCINLTVNLCMWQYIVSIEQRLTIADIKFYERFLRYRSSWKEVIWIKWIWQCLNRLQAVSSASCANCCQPRNIKIKKYTFVFHLGQYLPLSNGYIYFTLSFILRRTIKILSCTIQTYAQVNISKTCMNADHTFCRVWERNDAKYRNQWLVQCFHLNLSEQNK